MEQQIVLKSDEMQEKWKTCVRVTCHVFRTVEWLRDFIERALEAIEVFIESIKNAFISFTESLSICFEDLSKRLFKTDEEYTSKVYPQVYPQYVNNLKLNTTGFPRPITHCARSRC